MQVSIIHKTATVGDFRIDAECYQEKYISVERKLSKLRSTRLGQETRQFHKGIFDIRAESYSDSGVPFVRISNLRDCTIDRSSIIYIPICEHLRNPQSSLERGDVILSKTAFPAASLVDLDECNTSQDTIALKLSHDSQIESEYLVVFLNSKYGFCQMDRWFTGNVQTHLNLSDSRNIIIPVFGKSLLSAIKDLLHTSIRLKEASARMFDLAHALLLNELGLNDWKSKHQLTFVGSYSKTERAGRTDADYFQPKYEEIEDAIKRYPNGYTLIRNEFKHSKNSFERRETELYRYVEIGSINVSTGEILAIEVLGKDLPVNAKRVLRKGDVIVSKVRTYRGAITIVEENGYVGSGAFCVLREHGRTYKETLLAFLHSKPLLAWSLKPNTGTSYPVIVDDDILNAPIPILPEEMQIQIKRNITESFSLRKQSRRLIECAKRAVEIAIEQDEQSAISWLKSETDSLQMSASDSKFTYRYETE